MRCVVVFESMFGNTEAVARAVAEGLSARHQVEVVEVGAASTDIGDDVAMVVVGGPTHALGLSRPSTRADAAKQAPTLVSKTIGLREWLAEVNGGRGKLAAAFDTRANKPRLPGSAARAAQRRLRRAGFELAAPSTSFYVGGMAGPLLDGERDRARAWASTLGDTSGR